MTFSFGLFVERICLQVLRLSDGIPHPRARLQAPDNWLPAGLQISIGSKLEVCGTHVWFLTKSRWEGYQVLIWDWTTGELVFVMPFRSRSPLLSLTAFNQYRWICVVRSHM